MTIAARTAGPIAGPIAEPIAEPAAGTDRPRRVAVVVNPTKFRDLDDVRTRIAKVCADAGWTEPFWVETTVEDPGLGQAQAALEAGVDVVCPLGGDGTVRAVATSLVGTDTPIGLLPGGTGNLLARNLDLPVDSIEDALDIVLTGRDRRIDVGLVRLFPHSRSAEALKGALAAAEGAAESAAAAEDRAAEDGAGDDPRGPDEEVFLVMTGIGVDAEVMAVTNEKVKGIIGWPAYVLSGVGRLWARGFRVRVFASGLPPRVQHARSVIVGNCGTLQGNVRLMPDARLDDGRLDAVVMAPRGVFGWAAVAADLASRHRRGYRQLVRLRLTSMQATTEGPVEAQIDGDSMGPQHGLSVRVLPGALRVRVP